MKTYQKLSPFFVEMNKSLQEESTHREEIFTAQQDLLNERLNQVGYKLRDDFDRDRIEEYAADPSLALQQA